MNIDCIRDILIYTEDNTTFSKNLLAVAVIVKELEAKYDEETIYYHIGLIKQAGLVDNVNYGGNAPMFISKLSWDGHQFIENIRAQDNWAKIKKVAAKMGSYSLEVIKEIALGVVTNNLPF